MNTTNNKVKQTGSSFNNTPEIETLNSDDINRVSGAGIAPIKVKPLMAEDMYGNKLSPEEYMNFQLAVANGQAKPHDFGSWDK